MFDEVKCGKCVGYLALGDRFCRFCGTPRDAGWIEPRGSAMSCENGTFTVPRHHECRSCGEKWTTEVRIDKQRYCPRCGHDTYPDIDLSRIYEGGTWPFANIWELKFQLGPTNILDDKTLRNINTFGDIWWRDSIGRKSENLTLFRGELPQNSGEFHIHTVQIYEHRVFFEEEMFDIYWGWSDSSNPSVTHTIGESSFDVFKKIVTSGGTSLVEAIEREFSGPDGIKKVKRLCDKHGIDLRSFLT